MPFSSAWSLQIQYLNNCTCYNKIVCTILFSSRWWVYWYELFSVLSIIAKMAKFWWNTKSIIIRDFTNLGYFFIIRNIDIIRMCSWFWVKWCNWFCCIMFRCWIICSLMSQNQPLTCFDGRKAFKNISTTVHAMTKSFIPFCSAQDGEATDMNCLVFWAHW